MPSIIAYTNCFWRVASLHWVCARTCAHVTNVAKDQRSNLRLSLCTYPNCVSGFRMNIKHTQTQQKKSYRHEHTQGNVALVVHIPVWLRFSGWRHLGSSFDVLSKQFTPQWQGRVWSTRQSRSRHPMPGCSSSTAASCEQWLHLDIQKKLYSRQDKNYMNNSQQV